MQFKLLADCPGLLGKLAASHCFDHSSMLIGWPHTRLFNRTGPPEPAVVPAVGKGRRRVQAARPCLGGGHSYIAPSSPHISRPHTSSQAKHAHAAVRVAAANVPAGVPACGPQRAGVDAGGGPARGAALDDDGGPPDGPGARGDDAAPRCVLLRAWLPGNRSPIRFDSIRFDPMRFDSIASV